MKLPENRWKNNDFKYPNEVQFIYNNIIFRIIELIRKVEKKKFNKATIYAFKLGVLSDNNIIFRIIELIRKVEKKKFNKATIYAFKLGVLSDLDKCLKKIYKRGKEKK